MLPRSLVGRAILIVILPILVMQIIVTWVFFNAHWNTVTARMSEAVAGEVAAVVELYRENPSAERAGQLDGMFTETSELSIALERGDTLPSELRPSVFSNLDRTLDAALERRLEDAFWFDTTRYPNHIDIRVGVEEGTLRFIAARERVFAPTGLGFVLLLLATTLGLTLVSVIFIRNLAKPIVDLARAADAFGRGQTLENYTPKGASEVKLAGQSFLRMRSRVDRFVEQRTAMLAGVSHDLRTPLQRLKLQLAMSDDPDMQDARGDLAEMEAMLDGYLDFAKSDSVEASERVGLRALVAETAEAHDVEDVQLVADAVLDVRPQAVRRALDNLIGNAIKYANAQKVSLTRDGEEMVVAVEDDGPGIAEDMREEAMRPFSRLAAGRNQNIEGTGLGLAIARDIARTHGGKLVLGESAMGGLRVELRLPL